MSSLWTQCFSDKEQFLEILHWNQFCYLESFLIHTQSFLDTLYRSIYPINPLLEGGKRNDMVFTEFSSLSLIIVRCHPDCLTCSQSPDHCDLCQDPTKLLRNGQCVHSCGLGFYQAGALCLGTAPGRLPREGLRLTGILDGVMVQEMHNFQKPWEEGDVIRRLLDLSTPISHLMSVSTLTRRY